MQENDEVNYYEKIEEILVFYSCMSVQQDLKNTWYLYNARCSYMSKTTICEDG